MASLTEFEAVAQKFGNFVDFVLIYVNEAHPQETGDFSIVAIQMSSPKVIEERMVNAEVLQDKTGIDVFVDDMCNSASKMFGAMPERLYVIRDGRVVYKGGQGPWDYSVPKMEQWLQKYLNV